MNPIRKKMICFLNRLARSGLDTLDTQELPCVKKLTKVEVEHLIAEEIEKMCNTATLVEITRALLLSRRLEKSSGQEKEALKGNLNSMVEEWARRVDSNSILLKLSEVYCRQLSQL